MSIIIEKPEVWGKIVGARLIHFEVATDPVKDGDVTNEEAYCADEEIFMEFDNGKEMRIYINEDGNLSVYTD